MHLKLRFVALRGAEKKLVNVLLFLTQLSRDSLLRAGTYFSEKYDPRCACSACSPANHVALLWPLSSRPLFSLFHGVLGAGVGAKKQREF